MNGYLRLFFIAGFFPAVGMPSAPAADADISAGKRRFGLTMVPHNRKIEAK